MVAMFLIGARANRRRLTLISRSKFFHREGIRRINFSMNDLMGSSKIAFPLRIQTGSHENRPHEFDCNDRYASVTYELVLHAGGLNKNVRVVVKSALPSENSRSLGSIRTLPSINRGIYMTAPFVA